ncbi:MAG: acylneuraminate cytidylyltransferase family protein, partial [Lachnospiraceae bacterium]|nr:acylneuraminate cytidylyltransferase family protein [Lachnospiraceae bacterium]
KKSGLYDTIHVSTDSEKYMEIAKGYGAQVPFLRSPEIALDSSDPWDAVKEVLERYKELGQEFETITLLQPTSPLRRAKDIKNAFSLFREKEANAVISVCEAEHPPMWYHTLGNNGEMTDFFNDDEGKRRQDFDTFYRINGAIYLVRSSHFMGDRKLLFKEKVYACIMDRRASVDIDDKDDFEIAEALMKIKGGELLSHG